MRYTQRPTKAIAFQITREMISVYQAQGASAFPIDEEIPEWAQSHLTGGGPVDTDEPNLRFRETKESPTQDANIGDYIVREESGKVILLTETQFHNKFERE